MLFVTVYCCSIIYSKTESNESNGSKECEQQEHGEIENVKFQCMPRWEHGRLHAISHSEIIVAFVTLSTVKQ